MAFDLLVKNGMIVDGTGLPRYRGDIGVKDGKIAEIGRIAATAKDRFGAVLAIGCAATTRRSANDWRATWQRSTSCLRRPTTPARSRLAGSARCRWCAIAAPTTRCRLPGATARS